MNGLVLHCGASKVDRDELRRVPTPDATETWKPVAHHEIADMVAAEAKKRSFRIVDEEYGISPTGTKMFGVMRFQPQGHPEYTRALGIRNSNDKQIALGLTAGVSVFVCDNLCFYGESIVYRKHTSGIELKNIIPDAFDKIQLQYVMLDAKISVMKDSKVTLNEARITIVKAAEEDVIPSCDIVSVLQELKEPKHTEFSQLTRWSLYNSFTEMAKKYSPARADKCYRGLAQIFNLK